MESTAKAPVALFVYNRLDHTQRTVAALQQNVGAQETDLVIFSDGPKTEVDLAKVEEVRHYLQTIQGFKSVEMIAQKKNCGLAGSIISGVTTMIEEHGQVIVMEDDLVTSPYFLSYMNEGLEKYRHHPQVASIHGYVYPTKAILPETFFIRGADCWGWATWKKGWDHFQKDSHVLLQELKARKLGSTFNFDDSYDYVHMLEEQAAGRISSWAIRWNASAFLKGLLTLYPGISLVQNIGFDGSGTHCGDSDSCDVELAPRPLKLNDIPIEESAIARTAFIKYFNANKPPLITRVKIKVKHLLKKMI